MGRYPVLALRRGARIVGLTWYPVVRMNGRVDSNSAVSQLLHVYIELTASGAGSKGHTSLSYNSRLSPSLFSLYLSLYTHTVLLILQQQLDEISECYVTTPSFQNSGPSLKIIASLS